MTDIKDELSKILFNNGASIVGFADLEGIGHDYGPLAGSGVSIAVALNSDIIENIYEYPTEEYYLEYKRANTLLAELGNIAATTLKRMGYSSIELEPTKETEHYVNLGTPLPHKTVATRSGLGWIGKCALLVTKQFGSAVRLTSVLTDAHIEPGTPIDRSFCGRCMICVDLCPGKAPSGKNWNVSLKREDFFDAYICCDTAFARSESIGIDTTICGRCIAVCPFTQKYLTRSRDGLLPE